MIRAAELRPISLFGGLTDSQLAELADGSAEVRFEPGTELFLEDGRTDFWWLLVDGAIDLVRTSGLRTRRPITSSPARSSISARRRWR